jgi:drug/metabolite transporter (DMT)-like permease
MPSRFGGISFLGAWPRAAPQPRAGAFRREAAARGTVALPCPAKPCAAKALPCAGRSYYGVIRVLRFTRRSLALFGLVVLMAVWGSTFVVTKAVVRELPPLTLAALRFLLAALVLIPVALRRGGIRRLPRPIPLARLALMASSGVVTFSLGFNYALVYASATQGALIYALLPAAIAVAAVLALAEVPSRRRVAGILLSICGVAVVIASGKADTTSPAPLLGALCMFAAVVSWTVYTVFAKQLSDADQIVVTACVSALGGLMLIPFAAGELLTAPWPTPSLEGWIGLAFLSVVASGLAFIVYGQLLRELDASLIGAYANLDPIVGLLTAILVLGETLQALQVLGAVVALGGMWLASSTTTRAPRAASTT